MTNPAAARRGRRPGVRRRPPPGVADPSRGTRVAIGLPARRGRGDGALDPCSPASALETSRPDGGRARRRCGRGRARRRPARAAQLVHGFDAGDRPRGAARRPAPRRRRGRRDAAHPARSRSGAARPPRVASLPCRGSPPASSGWLCSRGRARTRSGGGRRDGGRGRRQHARPVPDHARAAPGAPARALAARACASTCSRPSSSCRCSSVLLIGRATSPVLVVATVVSLLDRAADRAAQPRDDRRGARGRAGECSP